MVVICTACESGQPGSGEIVEVASQPFGTSYNEWLEQHGRQAIVMESTAQYWKLARALRKLGYSVELTPVNPQPIAAGQA
jgi:hypothetical protein